MRQGTPQETVAMCRRCWQAGKDGQPVPQEAKDQPDEDVYDMLRYHYLDGMEGRPFDVAGACDAAGA